MEDILLKKELFGHDFAWGVSTAAFQTEGACDTDGKGPSIWDEFTHRKGKILKGETADTACEFYSNYQRDIDLVKQMNIPNFRFSIAWSRILPTGEGEVNQPGIDHYNKVIEYCLQQGVEPWLTIYHWDLPLALEKQGGWTNRNIIAWFLNYIEICALNFGDKVKHWMVMNEPAVFTGAGYFLGLHAPGRSGLKNFLPAVLHVSLSLAAGGKRLKELLPDAIVGTTFSCSAVDPFTHKPRDINAAKRADAIINRLFIEPVMGLGYPTVDVPVLEGIRNYMQPGDVNALKFDFDFIGLQCYTREMVRFSLFTPYIYASLVKAAKRKVPLTQMGWEVYPPSIYQVLKRFSAYAPDQQFYITENGAAFADELIDGEVDDQQRVEYLQRHIAQVLKAKREGVNIKGYFVWTLTDNFEWAEGYHPRFGLVHINFTDQKRTIKSSGKWYADLLAGK